MKQSRLAIFAFASILVLSCFAFAACGGGQSSSSASSSVQSSSSVQQESSSTESTEASTESTQASSSSQAMSESDVRAAFQQMMMGMVDFYSGTSEAGERVYYAGGTADSNAIIAFIEPESAQLASFVGPVTVSDDGRLTITDSSSNNSITFAVVGNSDSTVTFNMGSAYGTATVSPCASDEVLEALTQAYMTAMQSDASGANADASASSSSGTSTSTSAQSE